MTEYRFISAILTPLDEAEELHTDGLAAHLDDHIAKSMHGLLVAGSMGQMQLLKDSTYQALCRQCVQQFKGHGEVLVGAGDASLGRTLARVEFLNTLDIDGVAILLPFFRPFNQQELYDYFCAIAQASRAPIYMYDLPGLLGYGLTTETILKLQKVPNIAGMKASGPIEMTRQWIDQTDEDFRIIVAKPELMDLLCRHGIQDQLDGMWAIAPKWTMQVGQSAAAGDWATAAQATADITLLRAKALAAGMDAFTVLLNERGIAGNMFPKPTASLSPTARETLLGEPIVQKLLAEDPAGSQ
jgi:4-hydroxy-tetrahydrodipicolinate synthase